MNQEKIIIGMSGGVDSSVAAMLLQEQGYIIEGLFMKNWEEDDDEDYCAAQKDLEDANDVCSTLGIKLHSVNFSSEYWNRVFKHFLDEYSVGRTPNPDVLCNKEIKFRAFLDHAISLGAEKIATGHYARIGKTGSSVKLLRGFDHDKDQSYFLYMLDQRQLEHVLFPVGEYQKNDIRQLAKDRGLTTHDKKDSTGICFIGERRFDSFLQRYLSARPGNIESIDGKILGNHNGLMYYTMGQRKGLGIGGMQDADENPWYVVDKDMKRNVLIVAQGHKHPRLFHNILECSQIHWINDIIPADIVQMTAKIRYRQQDQVCHIGQVSDDHIKVIFDTPQRAITPGQSVVFYNGDNCLGGGIIETMYNEVSNVMESV